MSDFYSPHKYGKKEGEMMQIFNLQIDDAKKYFLNLIKPRLDRSYKLYMAYNGDRQKEIKKWQSNIFVPYIHAVVETLMPRILDARPEFTALARSEDDQEKAIKQQQLQDYTWEIAGMDKTVEAVTRAALVYGTGFMQVSWKIDKRKMKFLSTTDLSNKKYTYKEKELTFYDAPFCEWVDNYSLWYDWHNTERLNKQYWFKRMLLPASIIERRYPMADKKRLKMALASGNKDLTDYAIIRNDIKFTHEKTVRGAEIGSTSVIN